LKALNGSKKGGRKRDIDPSAKRDETGFCINISALWSTGIYCPFSAVFVRETGDP
jgi:hypothetical protein